MKNALLLIPLSLSPHAQASSLEDTNTYVKLVGSWHCVAPNGAVSVEKYTGIGEYESDAGGGSRYVGTATVEDGVLLTKFASPGSSFVSEMAE